MFSWLKRFFVKKRPIVIDIHSPTIPEAFGYPLNKYKALVEEISKCLVTDERLIVFEKYLNKDMKQLFFLDLSNPSDALILGYAFSSAVFLQRETSTQTAVKTVLSHFYPNMDKTKVN